MLILVRIGNFEFLDYGLWKYFISIQGFSSNVNVRCVRARLSLYLVPGLPGEGGGGRAGCGAPDALKPRDQAEHG